MINIQKLVEKVVVDLINEDMWWDMPKLHEHFGLQLTQLIGAIEINASDNVDSSLL